MSEQPSHNASSNQESLAGVSVGEANVHLAMRVSKNSIWANLFLLVIKLVAGIIARSGAMVSDAVHTASDVFTTIVVMIGIKAANKSSDEEHQYGHERLECLASIFLAALLIIVGLGIGWDGINKIKLGNAGNLEAPGLLALIAAIISIAVKEWQFWYTRAAALKTGSSSLMADAWHHRSDALSSIGAFVGILGARLGFPIMDPLASIVICLFIILASLNILKSAINQLIDKSCDKSMVEKIRQVVCAQQGVIALDDIKTRLFGSKVFVDIEIEADRSLPLYQAHAIAEQVHLSVEQNFPHVKHCMVHVNPSQPQPEQE